MIRRLITAWATSILFAIWSGLCIVVGAYLMKAATLADLARRGLLP